MSKTIALSHPGILLRQEFMDPLKITPYRLAKDIGVPLTRITNIVQGKRSITPDTALLLSQYFAMSEMFFINLQSHYDMETAKDSLRQNRRPAVRPLPRPDLEHRPH